MLGENLFRLMRRFRGIKESMMGIDSSIPIPVSPTPQKAREFQRVHGQYLERLDANIKNN